MSVLITWQEGKEEWEPAGWLQVFSGLRIHLLEWWDGFSSPEECTSITIIEML